MEQFIEKIYIFKRFACVFLLGIKCDASGFMAIVRIWSSYLRRNKHVNFIQRPKRNKNMQFCADADISKVKK